MNVSNLLWTKAQTEKGKILYVLNSHRSFNSDDQKQLEYAKLEKQKIQEITRGAYWISLGARNVIPNSDAHNLLTAAIRQDLTQEALETFDSLKPEDLEMTSIGFTYDEYHNRITDGKFQDNTRSDLITSSLEPSYIFFLHGASNSVAQDLLVLLSDLGQQNEGRDLAFDRALIEADFIWV